MTSYHGWTHAPKEEGGTDPIPGAGNTYSWARRRVYAQSNQSITDGSEVNVTMAHFATSDAGVFEAYDVGSADGITVLDNGLYLLTARLFWNDWPGAHEMTINGIDPGAFAGYTFHASAMANTLIHANGIHVRLAAGQDLYMTTYHEFGSARSIFGGAGGGGGTFFELVKLGPIDLTGRDFD